ncbi:MAG: DEAD/DEAH box helicase, partial [Planctomycetota bacterium]
MQRLVQANDLLRPVSDLAGVGPKRQRLLARLGIIRVGDLLHHFPRRHEDLRWDGRMESLCEGARRTLWGEVVALRHSPGGKGGKGRWVAELKLEKGTFPLVWFQSWRRTPPVEVGWCGFATGDVRRYRTLQLIHPRLEAAESASAPSLDHNRLVPIYATVEGIYQSSLRRWIHGILETLRLPLEERDARALFGEALSRSLEECYRGLHFPSNGAELAACRRSLSRLELALVAARQIESRQERESLSAPALPISEALDRRIRACFPFRFTPGQERAVAEIRADLVRPHPMRRLLVGEVGCGKTAVALYAAMAVLASHRQVALLAPSSALAHQHHHRIREYLKGSDVQTLLLVGGLPHSELE